jgi:lambda family phage tail tape measure protein
MTDTKKAEQALSDFAQGPAQDAAELAAQSFEQAGERIAQALERAARSGEFSFRNMASSISRDLAALAIQDLIIDPLQGALSGGSKSGGAAQSPNPLNIVMNITGVSDAGGFQKSLQKSQGQISASLARAVAQGQKFI